jgi:hypothetical protein
MNSNSKEMKRIIDAFKKPLRLNESMEGGEQLPNTITVKFNGNGFMRQYWQGTEGEKVYQQHGFASNLQNLEGEGHPNYGNDGLRMRKGYYYPLFKVFPKEKYKNSIWYYIVYINDEIIIIQSSEHSDQGYDISNYFGSLKGITHNWYCKFEEGITPGAKDHRGYFEIVDVK